MGYYTRGPICKNCCGQDESWLARHGHKRLGFWDTWSKEGVAICSNCGYERPYHKRSRNTSVVTPTQKKAVERIKQYFTDNIYPLGQEPAVFGITHCQETGFVYVTVETTENLCTQEGGFFKVNRRGGIEVMNTYGLNRKDNDKYYAKILGGKARR